MSARLPSRSERDLTREERALFEDSHAELRNAVAAYESVLGKGFCPGEPVPLPSDEAIGQAQERVDAAEDRLWELRERLLDWSRPSWAPRASLVSDWFSDEDADYDRAADSARS